VIVGPAEGSVKPFHLCHIGGLAPCLHELMSLLKEILRPLSTLLLNLLLYILDLLFNLHLFLFFSFRALHCCSLDQLALDSNELISLLLSSLPMKVLEDLC
jgi:hypothetical protein